MSLNRVSYLESWEQRAAPLLRRLEYSTDSDTEEDVSNDLPESLSSSYQSGFSQYSRSRLNFNPYAGPGWGYSSQADTENERQSLLGAGSGGAGGHSTNTRHGSDSDTTVMVVKDPHLTIRETTGAFETACDTGFVLEHDVPEFTRNMGLVNNWLGIVFGFAALKPVLIKEGVYRDHCTKEELENTEHVCYGQELRLNLMFTIAAVATNVCALPVGTILDSSGPRVSSLIGSFFLAAGALLFAFAKDLPFDGYMPGYLFLALGGPFVFISSFSLSNTFPTRSGLILSMLTGAFDASSALFLIFRIVHEKTNGTFSIKKFFGLYLIVPIFIVIAQIVLMPGASYKTEGELFQQAEAHIADEANDRVDESIADRAEGERQRNDRRLRRQSIIGEIQSLLDDGTGDRKISDLDVDFNDPEFASRHAQRQRTQQYQPVSKPEAAHSSGGVWGVMHGASALQQIQSPWFILITLFTIIQMLRINYFVATIRQQYEWLFASRRRARQLNQVFDVLLPLGGLVSIFFTGLILDTAATSSVLLILVAGATGIGILGCIPHSRTAGYANVALFVVYRPFYYTAVSDYAAKVFGFQTFGKVYGLVICLAGVSNFAQAGLDTLTFKVFHRNPIPVNVMLTTAAFLVGSVLVGFVWGRTKLMADAEADDAREEARRKGRRGEYVHSATGEGEGEGERERERLLRREERGGERPREYGAAAAGSA
ncbi:hypothetical protein VTN02DRAFT_6254 [Thermoascus thermophilus]